MGDDKTQARDHSGAGRSGASHGRTPDAVLITDAAESLQAQQKVRIRKYLTLMAFRIPALVIAGIAYGLSGSGWLALAIVVGSIPLPWIAVLIANDRPPRKRGEVPQYKYGADRSEGAPPAVGPAARVVDSTAEPAERHRRSR